MRINEKHEGKDLRYADANVIKIKHAVLEEVARLAFAGELEERKDDIPMKLIPGPTPQFRCCIYKEREIIRQRVRPCGGESSRTERRRKCDPGHQLRMRGLSDLQLYRDRELSELYRKGMYQRM